MNLATLITKYEPLVEKLNLHLIDVVRIYSRAEQKICEREKKRGTNNTYLSNEFIKRKAIDVTDRYLRRYYLKRGLYANERKNNA